MVSVFHSHVRLNVSTPGLESVDCVFPCWEKSFCRDLQASCERVQSALPALEASLRARLPDRARALKTRATVLLEQRKTLNVKMDSLRPLEEAHDNVRDELSPGVPVAASETSDGHTKEDDELLLPLREAACTGLVEEIKRLAAERLELLESVEELENDYARLYRDEEVKQIGENSPDAEGWRKTAFQAIQSDAISQELHEKVGVLATLILETFTRYAC